MGRDAGLAHRGIREGEEVARVENTLGFFSGYGADPGGKGQAPSGV